jgi:hypothetical protein
MRILMHPAGVNIKNNCIENKITHIAATSGIMPLYYQLIYFMKKERL